MTAASFDGGTEITYMSGTHEHHAEAQRTEPGAGGPSVERREALRRFGVYAACTAPAMTVLLASRQSAAGSFSSNSSANGPGKSGLGHGKGGHGGGGGGKPIFGGGGGGKPIFGGGGGGGGGCGFSC